MHVIHLGELQLRMRFGPQSVFEIWRAGRRDQLIIDLDGGNVSSSTHPPHHTCAWSMSAVSELRPSHDALSVFTADLGKHGDLIRRTFHAAVQRNLDPAVLKLTGALEPRLRLRAYPRLLRSPRLRQLAVSHPPACALALWGLSSTDSRFDAAQVFLDGIDAGRSLGELTHALMEALVSDGAPDRLPWLAQRLLLLKRAPTRLWPMMLCWLTPAAFVAEHIPRDERLRRIWYGLMHDPAIDHRDADEPGVVPLARFVSRHWAEVRRRRYDLGSLRRYAAESGRFPGTRTNATRWLADAALWFRVRLPKGLAQPAAGKTWSVRPLRTLAEIAAEGRRQHNCLGHGEVALPLEQRYFSALVGTRRLTVSVAQTGNDLSLGQVLASKNRPASARELRVIRRWFAGATAASTTGHAGAPAPHASEGSGQSRIT